jgi:hypothetical protein
MGGSAPVSCIIEAFMSISGPSMEVSSDESCARTCQAKECCRRVARVFRKPGEGPDGWRLGDAPLGTITKLIRIDQKKRSFGFTTLNWCGIREALEHVLLPAGL